MKLQYHKIRGVDKSVCTAEQKIAYNMAWRIYGDIRFAKPGSSMIPAKFPPSSKMIGNPKQSENTLPLGSAIITKLPPITTKTQSSVPCVPACMILSATTAPSSPPIKKSARRFPPTTSE